jgi:phospholipid transport system transporter-binding protein
VSARIHTDGSSLKLQGALNFVSAPALRAELERAIAEKGGRSLLLDFSEVTRSNSVGLSLLLSAARTADACKVALRVAGLPAGLLSMAGVCGLDEWLDTLSAEPAQHQGDT